MRRWFLSYNSHDLAAMQALEVSLRRKDAAADIFFAPKTLRAGGYWLPEVARAIKEATVFLLLVGEHGLGPWQTLEYYEALDRRATGIDLPVILVLLNGQPAPGLPFIRQLHWIVTADFSSEQTIGQLIEATAGRRTQPGELWRYTAPYRGLAAMEEADCDFFFGRTRETVDIINALAATPDRLTILLGNSGVGKSSLAQAGVLASLARQGWPDHAGDAGAWPAAFHDSRRWCFLRLRPGPEPLNALVEPFLRSWHFAATDPLWSRRQIDWVDALRDGKLGLPDLVDATQRRYEELEQSKPAEFFLYIDQGEELYVRSDVAQARRFSQIIAQGLSDRRIRMLMSLRSDFLGALQTDEALFGVHRKIDVPPLREAALREVVSRPAELLSARFETDWLADDIARRAAADSASDAGVLPLLSYLLDDMWARMVERGDGTLRLSPQARELSHVLVERANRFLGDHPGSEDRLRNILTLKLATVREDGEPTRRRALRSDFTDEEWGLVCELANYPYRLLVTAVDDGEAAAPEGVPYAEVAHEAIFRRWDKLGDWVASEREFLAWRTQLEGARRTWQCLSGETKNDALLMGHALAQARQWLARRATDIPALDREFIERSAMRERAARGQARRARALVAALFATIIGVVAVLALGGWLNQSYLKMRMRTLPDLISSKVLTPSAERALMPGQSLTECSVCPEMIVLPRGEFIMGSPENETGHEDAEQPEHRVTIEATFAVSKFELTFDEWDACYELGGCGTRSDIQRPDRNRLPVVNINWDDAREYVAWLSRRTGKPYRLLSEAEWEYAARAGSRTAYSWGDDVGEGHANCYGCAANSSYRNTAPVGSFAANAFGLHDMHGNVWEWTQDCYHDKYENAPPDGAAWTSGDCARRVVRGGSWESDPPLMRSAYRDGYAPSLRSSSLGVRVGRTLARQAFCWGVQKDRPCELFE